MLDDLCWDALDREIANARGLAVGNDGYAFDRVVGHDNLNLHRAVIAVCFCGVGACGLRHA